MARHPERSGCPTQASFARVGLLTFASDRLVVVRPIEIHVVTRGATAAKTGIIRNLVAGCPILFARFARKGWNHVAPQIRPSRSPHPRLWDMWDRQLNRSPTTGSLPVHHHFVVGVARAFHHHSAEFHHYHLRCQRARCPQLEHPRVRAGQPVILDHLFLHDVARQHC